MQRNVDIKESRRNGPQPSMRHDDDDDDDESLVGFSVIPKCTTLNDPE